MNKIREETVDNKEKAFIIEDNVLKDEAGKLDELSFSWSLMDLVKKVCRFFQSQCSTDIERCVSTYGWLYFIAFTISISSIILGVISIDKCYKARLTYIFLIVQGLCSLFVVLIQLTKSFFG
jgi:presenilin-like A22 family membrane protease